MENVKNYFQYSDPKMSCQLKVGSGKRLRIFQKFIPKITFKINLNLQFIIMSINKIENLFLKKLTKDLH